MLKILQARLQQYANRELPDVQAGFRKGRGTRDQIANICWIIEKAREFQKTIYFCFIDYAKAFDYVDHNKLENSSRDGSIRPLQLPPEKPACRSRSDRTKHGAMDWFQIGKGVHQFSSVQLLSRVQLLVTPWTAAHQACLSITNSWSLLKLTSIELVMPSNHLILCCPFLLPSSISSASGSFPLCHFFSSGGQSIGVSASTSVLSMNIQD